MHQVRSNRQRVVALRIVAYSVTLILTTITTIVLLYVALGYRFDRTGHVQRTGLLLVNNRQEAAEIYVDDSLKDSAAPGRLVLNTGSYKLGLRRAGYHDWSKQIQIEASAVREVTYPLLVPTKLDDQKVLELDTPTLISQSQDRKYVLTHVAGASQMQLIELDAESPKQTALVLPPQIVRESGQFGTLRVIEWALNSKNVLLEQQLPSGRTELISMDVTKPADAIVLTALYGAESPVDVHYVGGKTDLIYGLKDGVLSRYNLKQKESTPITTNIRSYQPYSDDTILFDRLEQQEVQIGILKGDDTVIVERRDPAVAPALLKYARFEGDFYFAITNASANKLTIYREPLQKPILKNQLPLKVISLEGIRKLDFSDSSQFVLAQSATDYVSYDLDDLLVYRKSFDFTLADGTFAHWIDGNHLQAQDQSGQNYIFDFDGGNKQKLSVSRLGTRLLFSGDLQYYYGAVDQANNRTDIFSTSMINDN